MKKLFLSVIVILAAAFFSNISAQTPPPVTGDKDLRDDNIRMRSTDLERTKRDAEKIGKAPAEKTVKMNFEEIKKDFEQIQNLQTSIVNVYTTGEKIDYAKISEHSENMLKSAVRLNSNLFPPKTDKNKKEKVNTQTDTKPKGIKELIVDLDNAIGNFVASPMFQNLSVVDPAVSEKTRADLEQIIKLSDALFHESKKMQ